MTSYTLSPEGITPWGVTTPSLAAWRKGRPMTDTATQVEEAAAAAEFQLLVTPEGRADPYRHYDTLREMAPIHRSVLANGWLLTRYADCHAVLRDPRMVRGFVPAMDARFPDWRDHLAIARSERSMLNLDGPDHVRLRKLVVKTFTPRSVEQLRPRMEVFVDELLEPLAASGGGDIMEALAFPLPVRVIGELLGIPEQDQAPFRSLVQKLTAIFEITATPEMLKDADGAQRESDAYFSDLIDTKRARPGNDLLSRLLTTEDSDGRLTSGELRTLAQLLFAAGFETTTNLVGNAMLGLLAHPEQMDILRARPELYSTLPNELLRYDGTVQVVGRCAAEPVEVDGVVFEAGDLVFPIVGAGNRDPAMYDNPHALDVTRQDVRPLTFGGGLHFCIGAALAKAETEIVFRKLLERFGTIELVGEAPYRDRLTLRGPSVVPVALAAHRTAPSPRRSTASTLRAVPPAHLADEPVVASAQKTPHRPSPAPDVMPVRPAVDDSTWRTEYRTRLEQTPGTVGGDVASVAALLGRVPFFAGCGPAELDDLAATAYPIAFETDETLCVEGAESLECYVIAEGEAAVLIGGDEIATVGADDVVGERGPLLGALRTATVVARSHMLTYAVSRDRLQRLVNESASARASMEKVLGRRFGTSPAPP
jgi:cytochrome P450